MDGGADMAELLGWRQGHMFLFCSMRVKMGFPTCARLAQSLGCRRAFVSPNSRRNEGDILCSTPNAD